MPNCKSCTTGFQIRPEDLVFYGQMNVPAPTLCPDCRAQRRYAFRNERKLYRRKCDLTGQSIISFHHPEKPFKVYDAKAWWSDRWDPLSYGRTFDFSRPFFEQFAALQRDVPRISMTNSHCENCDYAPYSVRSKNCYLCISCLDSEDLYYCYQTHKSRDCFDCSLCNQCELCYECLYCTRLTQSVHCKNCENGVGLYFCEDCRGCSYSIGCKNLVNKKYYIFNQPATQAEYERVKKSLKNRQELIRMSQKAHDFFFTQPQRHAYLINYQSVSGDHLTNCQNVWSSFDAKESQDCAYLYNMPGPAKDVQDAHYSPGSELLCEAMSAVNNYNTAFVLHSWDIKNSFYIDECFYSGDLFGCIGLRNKRYCILNKQYSREDYIQMVGQIVGQMVKTGEWGEFFPVSLSAFAYNETIAQQYFPLNKEQTLAKGWSWHDEKETPPDVTKIIPAQKLPDTIEKIPDDVLNWAIECETSKRPFKIMPQELAFYRKMSLPLPHLHPDERYKNRMERVNPRKLWDRNCGKCRKPIQTTYGPEKKEEVVCEECYLGEVY